MGYDAQFVLPIQDAANLMATLANVDRFEEKWEKADGAESGNNVMYIGGELGSITMTLLSEADYIVGVINGTNRRNQGE